MSADLEAGGGWDESSGDEDHGPTVLLVEAEEQDALLMQVGMWRAHLAVRLRWVRSGPEAIDYLAGRGPYADRTEHPMPALVLLNLKRPDAEGRSVLEWLRKHRALEKVPVVVCSDSAAESDWQRGRRLGADEYVVKANDLSRMRELLQAVCQRLG